MCLLFTVSPFLLYLQDGSGPPERPHRSVLQTLSPPATPLSRREMGEEGGLEIVQSPIVHELINHDYVIKL